MGSTDRRAPRRRPTSPAPPPAVAGLASPEEVAAFVARWSHRIRVLFPAVFVVLLLVLAAPFLWTGLRAPWDPPLATTVAELPTGGPGRLALTPAQARAVRCPRAFLPEALFSDFGADDDEFLAIPLVAETDLAAPATALLLIPAGASLPDGSALLACRGGATCPLDGDFAAAPGSLTTALQRCFPAAHVGALARDVAIVARARFTAGTALLAGVAILLIAAVVGIAMGRVIAWAFRGFVALMQAMLPGVALRPLPRDPWLLVMTAGGVLAIAALLWPALGAPEWARTGADTAETVAGQALAPGVVPCGAGVAALRVRTDQGGDILAWTTAPKVLDRLVPPDASAPSPIAFTGYPGAFPPRIAPANLADGCVAGGLTAPLPPVASWYEVRRRPRPDRAAVVALHVALPAGLAGLPLGFLIYMFALPYRLLRRQAQGAGNGPDVLDSGTNVA